MQMPTSGNQAPAAEVCVNLFSALKLNFFLSMKTHSLKSFLVGRCAGKNWMDGQADGRTAAKCKRRTVAIF